MLLFMGVRSYATFEESADNRDNSLFARAASGAREAAHAALYVTSAGPRAFLCAPHPALSAVPYRSIATRRFRVVSFGPRRLNVN
jgi:hypothetical protein